MIYTVEQIEFLKAFIPGHYHKEIIKAFNERWPEAGFHEGSVKYFIHKHKVNSGLTGHFPKGHVPSNKGRKGYYSPGSEKGWFKKGHSNNRLPVGSIRTRLGQKHRERGKQAEVFIKVAEPNKWRLYGRVLWEQTYGEIPKGMVVAFKDGDSTNVVIDNLRLISRSTLVVMNHQKLAFEGEARNVGITMAELKVAIAKNKTINSSDTENES